MHRLLARRSLRPLYRSVRDLTATYRAFSDTAHQVQVQREPLVDGLASVHLHAGRRTLRSGHRLGLPAPLPHLQVSQWSAVYSWSDASLPESLVPESCDRLAAAVARCLCFACEGCESAVDWNELGDIRLGGAGYKLAVVIQFIYI